MVKKRGYRIELGEIESAFYRHDGVDRAAVVARTDESGVSIAAFVALKPDQKRSIIAMKRHCTVYLPNYMVPDTITFLKTLPATSTDKVDYQQLKSMAVAGARSRHVTRFLREAFRWKFVFYELLLPALRRLGPARSDASLCAWAGPRSSSGRARKPGSCAPRGARKRVLDLDGPIGPCGPRWRRHGTLPGPRLPARRASDAAVLAPVPGPRARAPGPRLAAGRVRSSWAATWAPTLPACTGSFGPICRSRLVQRPRHVSRELLAASTPREVPHPQADALPPPRPA